ncbi:MAG: hypothetical protein K0S63_1112, partial [Gammaproteobacteria bacterium]|nr:hypothetical protein [Gammaproteobacteria bacterium]
MSQIWGGRVMANPRDISLETSEQVKQEIQNIRTQLSEKEFNVTGWGFHSLKMNGKRKDIPKTLYDAYVDMKKHLRDPKENPVKALAVYYAHLRVAIRPEHDHLSRHAETRAFYQEAAERTGKDIFPDNPQAAKQFDSYVKKKEASIAISRSPEQRKYLEFQNNLKAEINNV